MLGNAIVIENRRAETKADMNCRNVEILEWNHLALEV